MTQAMLKAEKEAARSSHTGDSFWVTPLGIPPRLATVRAGLRLGQGCTVPSVWPGAVLDTKQREVRWQRLPKSAGQILVSSLQKYIHPGFEAVGLPYYFAALEKDHMEWMRLSRGGSRFIGGPLIDASTVSSSFRSTFNHFSAQSSRCGDELAAVSPGSVVSPGARFLVAKKV
jgi:hypothetical protein